MLTQICRLSPKIREIRVLTFKLIEGKIETRVKKRKEDKKQGEKRTKVGEIEQISTSQLNTNYTSNYNKCKRMKLTG